MTKERAFDNALGGVSTILHLASPLANETDDYDRDIIQPAVNINLSLLNSALKAASVKRVIITSSMVTLVLFSWLGTPTTSIYDSANINTDTSGPFASAMEAYWSSKALARLAVRNFINKNSPKFEVVQLLPSVVLGADDQATSVQDLREQTPLWELKMNPILGIKQAMPMVGVPVDVADVAKAYIDAIKSSVPGSKGYILSAETPEGVEWDAQIETVKKFWPDRCGSEELPLGGTLPTMKWKIDVSKTEKAFGWKFRSYSDTIKDAVTQYLRFMDGEK